MVKEKKAQRELCVVYSCFLCSVDETKRFRNDRFSSETVFSPVSDILSFNCCFHQIFITIIKTNSTFVHIYGQKFKLMTESLLAYKITYIESTPLDCLVLNSAGATAD